jgi:DNA-nicking Smr family endonuclease
MAKKQEAEDFSFRPFKNLKKKIETEKLKPVVTVTAVKATTCQDDEELFRLGMKDVREIEEFRRILVPRRRHIPVTERRNADEEALKTLEEISKGRQPIRLADTQEYIDWVNPAYGGAAIAKKLHEGYFAVQDFIDLHGFTVDEAEVQIDGFLRSSRIRGLRCVKVIHGRGLKSPHGPVLKEALLGWLAGRHRKNIISFATARQCDGGLGALYILLSPRPVKKRFEGS